MARIRSIKPEFPQSESMGRVSRESRLCFVLLWTLADDAGRLRGNSRMLASLLYPYDDDAAERIEGWLAELHAEACIRRYQVRGDNYIEICNWLNHQKIDKPSQSKLPGFDEGASIIREDSPNVRESSALEGKGREGKGSEAKPRDPEPPPLALAPSPAAATPKPPRKPVEVPLPADFAISDRVRVWAQARNVPRLADHFEHFVGTARAKGYRYVDWDDAFMNAIRKNWAGIDPSAPGAGSRKVSL